jgi:phosphopantothenoylcysteine decarboxylase/phosphopantothenate--cysteine ligase
MERLSQTDVLIMAAAVADYRPVQQATQKIKKAEGGLVLRLERTQDILAAVTEARADKTQPADKAHPGLVVGFAAETEKLLENAEDKLRRKKPDLLVANDVSSSDSGFEVENNRVTLLTPDGQQESLPLMSKSEVAVRVLERVAALWKATHPVA